MTITDANQTAALTDPASRSTSGRNPQYDEELLALNDRYLENARNTGRSDADYAALRAAQEEEMRQFIERWKNNSTLSADQRQEITVLNKQQTYQTENRRISENYRANPTDPAARAAYEQRMQQRTETMRKAAQDPDLSQYPSVRRLAELQEQLTQAVGNPAREAEIRTQITTAGRQFQQELLANPQLAVERLSRFTERNQNDPVVQQSGLLDATRMLRERSSRSNGIGDVQVTANGAAVPGGVNGADPAHRDAATRGVAGAHDNGAGLGQPVRYESAAVTANGGALGPAVRGGSTSRGV